MDESRRSFSKYSNLSDSLTGQRSAIANTLPRMTALSPERTQGGNSTAAVLRMLQSPPTGNNTQHAADTEDAFGSDGSQGAEELFQSDRLRDITTPRVIITHLSGSKANVVQEFSVSAKREIWIGRHPVSHVRYPDEESVVSRAHLKITQNFGDPNSYVIVSRGRNGTFINDVEVHGSAGVTDGDLIQVGRGGPVFRFEQNPKPIECLLLGIDANGEGIDGDEPLPPDPTMTDVPANRFKETKAIQFDANIARAYEDAKRRSAAQRPSVLLAEETDAIVFVPMSTEPEHADKPIRWLYGSLAAAAVVIIGVIFNYMQHR